jgi:hypothetical protein
VLSNADLADQIIRHADSHTRAALAGTDHFMNSLVDDRRYEEVGPALDRYIRSMRSAPDLRAAGVIEPEEHLAVRLKEVRAAIESKLERGFLVVHPILPMPPRFTCPPMRRVITRAHGYSNDPRDPPERFNLGDKMDLVDGRVAPCATVMRALCGVMLNGLCEGVAEMRIELDTDAIPDFVHCMRAGVIGGMERLHLRFVEGTPRDRVGTALRSATEGNPRLERARQDGPDGATFTARPLTEAVRAEIKAARERGGQPAPSLVGRAAGALVASLSSMPRVP